MGGGTFTISLFDEAKASAERWPKQRSDCEDKRNQILRVLREIFGEVYPHLFAVCEITRVTEGAASMELIFVNQPESSLRTYQLQLRKVGSEAPPSDLGIYRLCPTGYPIERWYSRRKWEELPNQPDSVCKTSAELEDHFKWMISDPKSRLVALVAYFQQQTLVSGG